ncbi:MAG: ArsR/SmtB family transcription factor [Candidatus Nanohaloarchaea archaeon]
MADILRDREKVAAEELDIDALKALTDPTRMEILELLAEEPGYPAEMAKKMDIDRQKAYYHFKKLEEAGLIEEHSRQNVSGGQATFYQPSSGAYHLDLGVPGEEIRLPETRKDVSKFLEPLVSDFKLNGRIVVGSPDQHGPDQVRARDGHLAGEIAVSLGKHADPPEQLVFFDTSLFRQDDFDHNLLLLGGVLTNTATKKFNEEFPAHFSGDSFPYREIETPENRYTEDAIGLIARTSHPEDPEKALYLVAGIRNAGTEAAVRAFKNLDSVIHEYEGGDYYRIVRGLDLDGDGEIDSYEVVE